MHENKLGKKLVSVAAAAAMSVTALGTTVSSFATATVANAATVNELLGAGDFNDGSISYTHRILTQELDDAFTQSGKGLGISYNLNKFYFRIDNILISSNLKAYNCTVDRSIKASDHYPIWCYISKR